MARRRQVLIPPTRSWLKPSTAFLKPSTSPNLTSTWWTSTATRCRSQACAAKRPRSRSLTRVHNGLPDRFRAGLDRRRFSHYQHRARGVATRHQCGNMGEEPGGPRGNPVRLLELKDQAR
jgi:hypothetical protein